MKQIIFILFALSMICGALACLKEDMPKVVQADQKSHKYYTIEDFVFPFLRDGVRRKFHFATDQVTYDPWSQGSPQEAANLHLLDSTRYFRQGIQNAQFLDTEWDNYNALQYFKNGVVKALVDVYAEAALGSVYTHIPDESFNQLTVNNPNYYQKIIRQKKYVDYIDLDCGISKKKFFYTIFFNADSIGIDTKESQLCNSSVFSYQLITIN